MKQYVIFIRLKRNTDNSPVKLICQSQNTFVAIVDLPEGEHQYKFYVDGQWTHDPAEVSNYLYAPM